MQGDAPARWSVRQGLPIAATRDTSRDILRLHDTYTKAVEPFVPLDPEGRRVSMYTCGPTVYSYQHIGNFRSFVAADVIRRTLELHGYSVRHVMNLTDVGHMTQDHVADASGEDKLSKAARELGTDPFQVAEHFGRAFAEDARRMRLKLYLEPEASDPAIHPRATENIPEILGMIKTLIARGYAYLDSKGQAYFEVSRFPDYGRLSGKVIGELEPGARVAIVNEKRDPRDFALWKVDDKHLMRWDPNGSLGWRPDDYERLRMLTGAQFPGLGVGFPGWHIECSAMIHRFLGEPIDIHTGGEDNIFPHHECELAQTCGAFSTTVPSTPGASDSPSLRNSFVRHWFHVHHLMVDGRKMSKSAGTLYTLRELTDGSARDKPDLLSRFESVGLSDGRVSPSVVRYALLSNSFSQPMNFTFEALAQAEASVQRLTACVHELEAVAASAATAPADGAEGFEEIAEEHRRAFLGSLDDNLNMPRALAVVFDFVRALYKAPRNPAVAALGISVLQYFDSVLDVMGGVSITVVPHARLESVIRGLAARPAGYADDLARLSLVELLALRQQARKERMFQRADAIRDWIRGQGTEIEDAPGGVRVRARSD